MPPTNHKLISRDSTIFLPQPWHLRSTPYCVQVGFSDGAAFVLTIVGVRVLDFLPSADAVSAKT